MAVEAKRPEVDLETMRHSFAHVLAMAVQRLYPGVRLGIGPATKNGFYYEFDLQEKIDDNELAKIEDEMRKIIAEEIPFKQIMVNREQAFNTLIQLGQIYKTELLQTITDNQISFFRTGEEFIDLCRGPHVNNTGELGVFKLLRCTSVHWLSDETRPIIQRIEGIGFATPEQMFEYEKKLREINQRDHKKQLKALDLAIINSKDNNSRIYWLQKGFLLKTIIIQEIQETLKLQKFTETTTPQFNFQENPQGDTIEVRQNFLTNMLTLFDYKRRSYKEMPLRIFEIGTSKSTDKSHNHGLFDIREKDTVEGYTFCENHDIALQISQAITSNIAIYKLFGLENLIVELCVPDLSEIKLDDRDKKHLNDSYQILKNSLAENEISYKITTKTPFIYYAPYISFSIKDMHDRDWEIGKITHVYEPKLKPCFYINARNNKEKSEIIYNQIIYSLERLLAYLLETFDGSFPTWMSPVQVDLLSISEKYNEYVSQLNSELQKDNIRSNLNLSSDPIQTKIRKSQMTKVPYMLIIGEKEIKTNSVSLRNRNGQELGLIRIDEFIEKLKSEINIEKNVAV
jgi:threonyl-tRNA synthetase